MIETVVYTTLTIIVILLIKDLIFKKDGLKNSMKWESFIYKAINEDFIKGKTIEVRKKDLFNLDKPFVIIGRIGFNTDFLVRIIDDSKEYEELKTYCRIVPLQPLNPLTIDLLQYNKIDNILGKRVIFYNLPPYTNV